MVTSAYEFRKKLRAKKQKEFSKICHICKKELTIRKEDVIYMVDNKSVHSHCFRKWGKFVVENLESFNDVEHNSIK